MIVVAHGFVLQSERLRVPGSVTAGHREAGFASMLQEYLVLLIMLAVAAGLAGALLLLSALLGPRKPTPEKLRPYECGTIPLEDANKSTWVRFYLIAMLFILFDMEVIFLYPWAVVYRRLSVFGLGEMAAFIGVLVLGYVYAWRKGALEWD